VGAKHLQQLLIAATPAPRLSVSRPPWVMFPSPEAPHGRELTGQGRKVSPELGVGTPVPRPSQARGLATFSASSRSSPPPMRRPHCRRWRPCADALLGILRTAIHTRAAPMAAPLGITWCEQQGVRSIVEVQPLHVGTYVEMLMRAWRDRD
jgi:hypothetical protein